MNEEMPSNAGQFRFMKNNCLPIKASAIACIYPGVYAPNTGRNYKPST